MESLRVQMAVGHREKKVFVCIIIALILVLTMITTGILIYENIQKNVDVGQTNSMHIPVSHTAYVTPESSSPSTSTPGQSPKAVTVNSLKSSQPQPSTRDMPSDRTNTRKINVMSSTRILSIAHVPWSTSPKLSSINPTKDQERTNDLVTSNLSTVHSSTEVTFNPILLTSLGNTTSTLISITSQQSSTEGIVNLIAAVSDIHPDICLNVTTDMCKNRDDSVPIFCECDNEGVWTIIQKRFGGYVDFYRNWTEYKEGFGYLNGEYWLGNEALHQITSNGHYMLKIVLQDWDGVTKYAKYDAFRIADEADNYRLTLGSYSGDAGNSMNYNNGEQFSTRDRDNDANPDTSCALIDRSAWWYNHCTVANLNGLYYNGSHPGGVATKGIIWYYWHGWYYSLKETKMMILKSNTQQTIPDPVQNNLSISSCQQYASTDLHDTWPASASGIHPDICANITTDMCSNATENVQTFCECDNEGVWAIIQRRFDGCVDFYRNWTDYKVGFGNINGEYWLGNDAVHQITSNADYTLKVVLKDWEGVTKYAKYNAFRMADEADNYRLTLGSYSGTAGNSMNYNNGQQFSTWDRDNDGYTDVSCAQAESSAWWHNHCTIANLNGVYFYEPNPERGVYIRGIFWYHLHGWNYSFKEAKMMIKMT